jgi:hypothetical protein
MIERQPKRKNLFLLLLLLGSFDVVVVFSLVEVKSPKGHTMRSCR